MNVTTITMDPEEAREKLRAYRKHLHSDAEFEAAVRGYSALARGSKLLHLGQAFHGCPVDEKGRPKLAIARADQKQVAVRIMERATEAIFDARNDWGRGNPGSRRIAVTLAKAAPKVHKQFTWSTEIRGYALVPMIPADVRPTRMDAKAHFILWEVEQWAEERIGAQPDRDPFLLRHLGGQLYAIVAEWDLTELERAIIAGTRRDA